MPDVDVSDPLGFMETLLVPASQSLFILIIILGSVWLLWKNVLKKL